MRRAVIIAFSISIPGKKKTKYFLPEERSEHGNVYSRGGESNPQLCGQRAGGKQQVFEVGTPAGTAHCAPYIQLRKSVPVFRLREVYPRSEFFPFRNRISEFKYFNPKKLFLCSRKSYPGFSSRIRIPDLGILPIPDPRFRGQKGIGSRIRIRNTGQPLNNVLIYISVRSLSMIVESFASLLKKDKSSSRVL